MKIRIVGKLPWNYRTALIYGVALFLSFGPLQLLLHNNDYQNSIFSNSPFLYFVTQGAFIAASSVVVVSLVNRAMKMRQNSSHRPE